MFTPHIFEDTDGRRRRFFFWGGVRYYVSCIECAGQENDFELIPTVTRRPASADRTARAANFRRDLEAT